MGLLVEGRWRDQWYDTAVDGRFQHENVRPNRYLGGQLADG
jgi:hypothetical protein